MALVQVRLARDSMQTPWGFRLQGGKDLNQPLTVQRVFANTPSERELHRGDVIVAINGRDTSNLSHKQAQDAISGGGGQIEFLVQRPAGTINIKPLSPVIDTRAPSLPHSPTRAPQINIPIQRKQGPLSPTRTIPISPQKPSPPKPAAKPVQRPVQNIEQNRDMSAGFMPKKVTLTKFGGGGPDFGSAYGGAAHPRPVQTQYRPVAAPVQSQPARDQYDYGGQPPQPPQPTQNQFSAPQPHSPQPVAEEKLVEEEEYGGVNERRRLFMKGAPQPPNALGSDEDDYPTAPVWERRKMFGKQRAPPPAIQRSRKTTPSFGRARAPDDGSYTTFGVDYTKPQPKPQPKATSSRPRPPAVNARREEDDIDGQPWSNTLRSEGQQLKPWEREALEAERYQSGTVDQPYRPHMSPQSTAPKPRIVQISAQSTVRPQEQISASTAHSVSTQPKKPVAPGERNWNDSYVYQMVHSTKKTTRSNYEDTPGQAPKGETVTTTRETHETKIPGQEPQRRVTETVQRSGVPDYKFDAAIGLSDF